MGTTNGRTLSPLDLQLEAAAEEMLLADAASEDVDDELVEVDCDVVEPPEEWEPHEPPPLEDEGSAAQPMGASRSRTVSYVSAGWSVGSASAIGIKTYAVAGTKKKVSLPVRSSCAPLLLWAARDWHKHMEKLRPGWCWGYAYRQITGGSGWSWHAAGIAVDLNAPLHPYGKAGTFTLLQEHFGDAIARKYGLRWGNNYSSNPDGMHLEVVLTPDAAKKRIAELRKHPGMVLPYPGELKRGDSGIDVRALQRALRRRSLPTNPAVDGKFGATTGRAVRELQKRQGLEVDGTVGRKVWDVLF